MKTQTAFTCDDTRDAKRYKAPALGKVSDKTGNWLSPFAFLHNPEADFTEARNAKPEKETREFRARFGGDTPYYPATDYYAPVLNAVRARLFKNGGDTTEARDIADHVIGRAEMLFQEKAIPDYEKYSGELPNSKLGRFGLGSFYLDNGDIRWRAGDGNHKYAIRPGVIMYRARKFADTCANNGGYNRVSRGIENSVRGGGKFRVEVCTGFDKRGNREYELRAAPETRYDLAIHGAVNESPRALAFGQRQVNAYEPAILARLSSENRAALARHVSGKPLDARTCETGKRRNRRLVAALESVCRQAIAAYLDNTAYARS